MYKKSTNEYFYKPDTNINKGIQLLNDKGNKKQIRIITLIKDSFQLKYDYIYYDEYFYTIPTLKRYGISNYNRVINYESGFILKTIQDNNKLFVYSKLWYDNGQKYEYPSIEKLWNKVHGTLDIIDINNEMDFMQEQEFYRYIPGFPKYRVSNYANIKNDEKNEYITPRLNGEYYIIRLSYKNENYNKKLHQIVILRFHGYPPSENHTVEP